jgi:hypothetical protein
LKQWLDSKSTCNQEAFVINILKEKTNGYYVELGSEEPIEHSNTYLLESKFNWNGFGLDIDDKKIQKYNAHRKNKSILHDASTFNFTKYFEDNNFPKQIDYLQIDLDSSPVDISLKALINIPLNQYRFSVITFEHDDLRSYKNHRVRDLSRQILDVFGYQLVVLESGEDFWVDPKVIQENDYQLYFGPIMKVNYMQTDQVNKPTH